MKKTHFRRLLTVIAALAVMISSMQMASSAETPGDGNANGYVEITSKRDEFTRHYLNPDGTVTAVMYGEQIHLSDGDNWVDIDNSLVFDETSGRYENKNNPSFRVSFAERTDGNTPSVLFDEISWRIYADGRSPSSGRLYIESEEWILEDDEYPVPENLVQTVIYDSPFGSGTKLRYTVSHNRLEEDLIFDYVPEIGTLTFEYNAGDYNLILNDDGSAVFLDEEGNTVIKVGAPLMYDAAGAACDKVPVTLKESEGGKQSLEYSLDSEWLGSPDRVYPVTFDPTITNSQYTNTLYDTYTKSGSTANNSSSASLYVGHYGSNTYHTFLRFSALPNIGTYSVATNATLKLTFAYHTTTMEPIGIYPVNGTWDQSTITYLNEPSVGSLISTGNITWSGSYIMTATYQILPQIKLYLHGVNTGHNGFMLRYTDESTTNDYNVFGSIQNSTSSRRPVLTVTYTEHNYDEFYSMPTSSMYLFTDTSDEVRLEKRSNCYGYAFRMFYSEAFPINNRYYYLQQPGEFADKSGGLTIYNDGGVDYTISNYAQLRVLYQNYFNSTHTSDERMNIIVQLIQADASTLGYTVTEYTGSTIPDATLDKRLIAVVTSPPTAEVIDYHFYMQHTDNTWTHKQGSTAPSNQSITSHTALTNSNIQVKANEGIYANGSLKFFYITKSAVVDFPHGDGITYVNNHSPAFTTTLTLDNSGEDFWNSKNYGMISGTNVYFSGRFDYPYDADCFSFIAPAFDEYHFYVTSNVSPIVTYIFDENMDVYLAYNVTGSAPYLLSANLNAGRRYYIQFQYPEYTSYSYSAIPRTYTVQITH